MAIILKSIKPGRHFRIMAYKPDRGPGYVVATEVIIERAENGRIVAFATELFNPDYPTVRVNVEGRMTAKNKAAALRTLIDHLTDKKMVEENQEVIGNLD